MCRMPLLAFSNNKILNSTKAVHSSQLPEDRKLDLLKALAEVSPYTTPQDSRQILPSIVQLLKVSSFSRS